MELLKKLYEIHSPSGRERKIKNFIKRYIRTNIPDCKIESDKLGNLYVTKGTALEYPCIVAHLDQVQKLHSADFKAIETAEIFFGYSAKDKIFQGLGADDKNGIWVALTCLKEYDSLKIAFFVKEEIGCIGSSGADLSFFDDCRFVIEADRKGASDFITYIGFTSLCSEEFLKDCNIEKFGYKEESGMMTDVLALKENGLGISVVNISCGYYEPHTDNEFIVKADLLNCLALVKHIIENCTKVYPHKDENSWDYYGSENFSHDFLDEYYELETIVEELYNFDPTVTADELFSEYSEIYQSLTIDDIEELLYSQKRRNFNY